MIRAVGAVVRWCGGQTKLDHMVYKSLMFVSARDFCTMTHWRVRVCLPDSCVK